MGYNNNNSRAVYIVRFEPMDEKGNCKIVNRRAVYLINRVTTIDLMPNEQIEYIRNSFVQYEQSGGYDPTINSSCLIYWQNSGIHILQNELIKFDVTRCASYKESQTFELIENIDALTDANYTKLIYSKLQDILNALLVP